MKAFTLFAIDKLRTVFVFQFTQRIVLDCQPHRDRSGEDDQNRTEHRISEGGYETELTTRVNFPLNPGKPTSCIYVTCIVPKVELALVELH